ncbi:hypothetical protein FACS189499_07970 [Clostridia bacterium]|nr:hypothetical protein FACS189499_07970 [Clostridia bacterium]
MITQKAKLPKPIFIMMLIILIPITIIIVFAGATWLRMLYVSDVELSRRMAVTSPIESYLSAKYPELNCHVTVHDADYGKGDMFSGMNFNPWEEMMTYLPVGRAEVEVYESYSSLSSSRYKYTFYVDYDIESMTFSDNYAEVLTTHRIRIDTQKYIDSLFPGEPSASGSFDNAKTDIPLPERSFEAYLKRSTLVIYIKGYDVDNKYTQNAGEMNEFTEKHNKILEETSKSDDVFGFLVRYEFLGESHVVNATESYTEYDHLYQYYAIKNGVSDKRKI